MTKQNLHAPAAESYVLRTSVAQGVLATLWIVAGVICWRRLAGEFPPPTSIAPAVFTTIAATVAGVWACWSVEDEASISSERYSFFAPFRGSRSRSLFGLIPAVLLGWALLPVHSIAGQAAITALPTIALCGTIWAREAQQIATGLSELAEQSDVFFPQFSLADDVAESSLDAAPPVVQHCATESELELPAIQNRENVTLWMTRGLDDEGRDSLEGGTKVRFLPGQKLAVVHLGFFPSFAQTPEMECEVLDEGVFHIRTAAVYPYGARLEVQRPAPLDESAVIELAFVASSPAAAISSAA